MSNQAPERPILRVDGRIVTIHHAGRIVGAWVIPRYCYTGVSPTLAMAEAVREMLRVDGGHAHWDHTDYGVIMRDDPPDFVMRPGYEDDLFLRIGDHSWHASARIEERDIIEASSASAARMKRLNTLAQAIVPIFASVTVTNWHEAAPEPTP